MQALTEEHMDDLTIRQLLNAVHDGKLRVPAFQRGFVWDANRVAFLMDSLYKRYPIGSLLVWRTRERLKHERKLGSFSLPNPEDDYPIEYILDGQQRVTSIFGVFQTDIKPDDDAAWTKIYFDLLANQDIQESQFVALEDNEVDPDRHFSLKTLFDSVSYRQATEGRPAQQIRQIDKMQEIFKEAKVPIQMITTEDRTTVAIVFERVNQRSVPLDTLQLLTAWTWSQDFHLQQQFEGLTNELEPFGFDEIGEDNNLLLRCCAAVLGQNPSTETLINLNGSVVRDRFPEVISGIKGAIDFLRRNLHIHALNNLPYPNLIVPLCVFFASPNTQQVRVTDKQRKTILRWFWRACFSKRYNSQPIKSIHTDVEEILKLKNNQSSELGNFTFPTISPEFFTNETFRLNNVTTKTFILLLAQHHPVSFVSGSNISLSEVLRDYNRNEFHHLFPKSYLKTISLKEDKINCLANFCFMSKSDNNHLGGDAPKIYRKKLPSDIDTILGHAFCPNSLFGDDYLIFLRERSSLLAQEANRLLNQL